MQRTPRTTSPDRPAETANPTLTEDTLELSGTTTPPAESPTYTRPRPDYQPPPTHDRFADLEKRASAMTPTLLSIMVRARYDPYTHGGLNE